MNEPKNNRVVLTGMVGREPAPEMKTLPSGYKILRFMLHTNDPFTRQDGQQDNDNQVHSIIMWEHWRSRHR